MKDAAITQIIAHYLAKNFESLEGAMPKERYFLVAGASIGERSYAKPRIAIGTAIDVLADQIEKERFFGWFVPEEVSQATNPRNSGISLLNTGEKIHGEFEITLLKNRVWIAAEKIGRKDYLTILRTAKGFKQAAELLGIEENLEEVASTIYRTH